MKESHFQLLNLSPLKRTWGVKMKSVRVIAISILVTIIIGLSILLVLGINGGIRFYGGGMVQSGGDGWTYGSTLQNTTSLEADGITKLEVDYSKTPFTIYFEVADDDKVTVEEFFSKSVSDHKMAKITMSGSQLTIKQQYNTDTNSFLDNISGYIFIYLPADIFESLKDINVVTTSGEIWFSEWAFTETNCLEKISLSTTSGDIRLENMKAENVKLTSTSGEIDTGIITGDIVVSTTSGDQKIEEVHGAVSMRAVSGALKAGKIFGDLDMSTTSGDQKIEWAEGSLEMGTTSGELKVDMLRGNGNFNSSSGDVRVMVEELTGDLKVSSISGEITINLPPDSGFYFKANTVSGDISTSYDEQLTFNKKGKEAEGTVGGSSQYEIKMSTTSGDIKVRQ